MKNLLLICSLLLLSACSTLEITEKNFILPDKQSGWTSTQKLATQQSGDPAAKGIKELEVVSTDGVVLKGIDAQFSDQLPTVLYFGGNMFHIDSAGTELLETMRSCPVNVKTFDYRGYGRSQGDPDTQNLQRDALAIYDQVRANTKGRLIVHGHSLGSFIAAYVSSQRKLDGLVLESTATNALDMVNASLPWYIKSFTNVAISEPLKKIDNTASIQQHQGKSLVLVGELDKVTPPSLGERVYAAIPTSNKRFVVSAGGKHNSLLKTTEARLAYCQFVTQ